MIILPHPKLQVADVWRCGATNQSIAAVARRLRGASCSGPHFLEKGEDMQTQPYTESFYNEEYQGRTRRSAKEIVPLALDLVQPKQVIDVGCGIGIWLSVFKELGVQDVWGIDGDWVDRKMLQIPAERFVSCDMTKPFRMERQFDLVVSMEVAEHLPKQSAEGFVDSLVRLGPVILFSAAIPYQGGVQHLNEQWPDYWAKYFREKGYVVVDCMRKRIWQNDHVDWWYTQNSFIFVRSDRLDDYPLLKREVENTVGSQLSMVHPRKYLELINNQQKLSDPRSRSLKEVVSALPTITKDTLVRRMRVLKDRLAGRS